MAVLFLAGTAAAAGDVEGNGDEITFLEGLYPDPPSAASSRPIQPSIRSRVGTRCARLFGQRSELPARFRGPRKSLWEVSADMYRVARDTAAPPLRAG